MAAASGVDVKIELTVSSSGIFAIEAKSANRSDRLATTRRFEKGSVRIHRITIVNGPRTYLIQHLGTYARFKNQWKALSEPSNVSGRFRLAVLLVLALYSLIITTLVIFAL